MSTLAPRVFAAYQSFRDRRRAVRALATMDDALLKDIGISRSQIHSRVHGPRPSRYGMAG